LNLAFSFESLRYLINVKLETARGRFHQIVQIAK